MWSLLWIRLGRRIVFWSKLAFFSSVVHVFLLFIIFFLYSGQESVFNVNIKSLALKSGAPIIFMPLRRSMPKIAKNISTHVAVSKKKVVKKPSLAKKKVPVKKVVKKTVVVKKVPQKKTIVPKKKSCLVKKTPKKTTRKVKCEKKKKIIKKRVVVKEKVAVKKPVIKKKVLQKKFKIPVKKPEKKILDKKIVLDKKLVNEKKVEKKIDDVQPEAIYIGQQELEALKVQYEIEREVAKYWRPPVGLSKKLFCTINVLVDWNGFIKKVTVTKPSGALMFDIAARTAVGKLNFPKSLWGKEVNINFG